MLDAQVRAVIRVFDPHGVLSGLVDRDYLTEREATDFGYGILAGNSRRLHGIAG